MTLVSTVAVLGRRRTGERWLLLCATILFLTLLPGSGHGKEPLCGGTCTLSEVVEYAIRNNPKIRLSTKEIELETLGIDAAQADRFPKVDLNGGFSNYRYPTPITPIVISGFRGLGTDFPAFERTIYDAGLSFRLPIFRGGRLVRAVHIAETRKAVAEDSYRQSVQELTFNLASTYYKILQLESLLASSKASVKQLEAHRKDVELLLKTGSVPRIDLLKTEVEVAHARETTLRVTHSLENTYELLKTFMGIEDPDTTIAVREDFPAAPPEGDLAPDLERALARRPDLKAMQKKREIAGERVKIAQAKRLPDLFAVGDYIDRAGPNLDYRENWSLGVRFILPVFDGGLITSEIQKAKKEVEKTVEEERALRLEISREVREARLQIANATERIGVTKEVVGTAEETRRIEALKYTTGAGTSTDVIDAQTALLRAQADYYQALYEKATAVALWRKVVGE
jgi:outer membrane protein